MYGWLSSEVTGAKDDMWTEDGETPLSLSIKAGQGFYIYTESENATIQVAGQVKIGAYEKTLHPGYNLTGNFAPVAMDIQNIKLENVAGEGTDLIWILDTNGIVTGEMYGWLSSEVTGAQADMWTEDGETPLSKTIQPGEGLYLYTEAENGKITIPAVIEGK